jgi:hypothetical protein
VGVGGHTESQDNSITTAMSREFSGLGCKGNFHAIALEQGQAKDRAPEFRYNLQNPFTGIGHL